MLFNTEYIYITYRQDAEYEVNMTHLSGPHHLNVPALSSHLGVHPSIISTAYPLRVAGKLELILADFRHKAGYNLSRAPFYHRLTQTSHSHSHLWEIWSKQLT